jgi:hypothetical protein
MTLFSNCNIQYRSHIKSWRPKTFVHCNKIEKLHMSSPSCMSKVFSYGRKHYCNYFSDNLFRAEPPNFAKRIKITLQPKTLLSLLSCRGKSRDKQPANGSEYGFTSACDVTSLEFCEPLGTPQPMAKLKGRGQGRGRRLKIKREPAVEGATIRERMRKEIEGPGTSSYFLVLTKITESSSKG